MLKYLKLGFYLFTHDNKGMGEVPIIIHNIIKISIKISKKQIHS